MKTKIFLAVILVGAVIAVAFAQKGNDGDITLPDEVKKWETLAEQGDTAALHNLLRYYDENAVIYVEVEAVVSADGEEYPQEVVDSINMANKNMANEACANLCSERLDYWLNKGLAQNDPVAINIKGQRDYYNDEDGSIESLSKAAEAGDSKAALFCGSACFNQGRYAEAVRYHTMAYKAGVPSAGWHLAMCYSGGLGVKKDISKAIELLRHSAMMDYPEAVLEMKRIEPENPLWQHKVDSLEIDFPDFPIIPMD